jgi:hypothetical protein
MTFIASVIAKDGVAVIADSLMTTSEPVISKQAISKYISDKTKNPSGPSADVSITFEEIVGLFEYKKSFTKDYEEKLIEYDRYTCVTFTGSASINGIKISKLIYDLIERNKKNRKVYNKKKILTKVNDFTKFVEIEAKKHLRNKNSIGDITFIITHYNPKIKKTDIYKIDIKSSDKNALLNGTKFVNYKKTYDWEKVVSDGQNKITTSILWGHLNSLPVFMKNVAPLLIDNLVKELNIDRSQITSELVSKVTNLDRMPEAIFNEVKLAGLELSLQQATDLAALLMRVEMDFQKYLEDVPTVGGVIKLATISKKGVEFICGDSILKPVNI